MRRDHGGGMEINMVKISRQEAREILFGLLFETEFHGGENPNAVYERACAEREIPSDKYVRECFFGVISRSELLDTVISSYAKGWKAERLSKVSRTVIRIAVYEMLFLDSVPMNVSIAEAVDISARYGEDKAKQFVNGVLSGLFKDISAKGVEAVIAEANAALEKKAGATIEAEATEAAEATETDGENA